MSTEPLPKIVAVVGPTASGKTAWGVSLAQRFNGAIVSADAKQVYRHMDIGTAKEKDLPVDQFLIDIKDPGEKITVAEFQSQAYGVIDDLLKVGKVPFLVGGSGLYAESVLNGYTFDPEDPQRPHYQSIAIGIAHDRDVLKARVRLRTKSWVDAGLLEEIESLRSRGISDEWIMSCGMEYKYFTMYLRGEMDMDVALEKTNISIDQFIKRQYTWWRRYGSVHWLDNISEAEALVADFLTSK